VTEIKSDAVRWELFAPGTLLIELQNGPANALGYPLIDGLGAALDAADADPTIRAIVIASTVPGFFAAGADIKLMSSVDASGFAKYGDALRATLDRLAAPGRVSIAAIEGVALGGGLELALSCTMRVAGNGARFGLPEVKLGLIPGAGGTQRLPRLIGRGRALDIMLTARQVKAAEALSIGLVDRLVEDGVVANAALELAAQLLGSSAAARAAVIRTVDAAFDLPLSEGMALERGQVGALFEHGEGREGIAAFVEKRPPIFR
jgi:enoyl-CoA hydratase/carnithine racemase